MCNVSRPLCLSAALLAIPAGLYAADWKPIDPAELALKAPTVQNDADAEAFFWEVRVADEMSADYFEARSVFEHYLRFKIFTDRGRESYSSVSIPYLTGTDVSRVEARTIRADGSVVELKKADVFDRTVVKAEGFRAKVISFAVPGIERGAIVEYRWRESHRNSLADALRLPLSREMPVQQVRYYLRPLVISGFPLSMRYVPFNAAVTPPQHQKDGSAMLSLANVPAQSDEPYSTPIYERRPWIFVYYELASRNSDVEFWPRFARGLHESYGRRAKVRGEVRRFALEATAGAVTVAEKVAALVKAGKDRIRRTDLDTTPIAERRKARHNDDAAEVLERRQGTGGDMVLLFLAMAAAVGLDARVAAAPDRSDLFHKPAHRHAHFVRHRVVAVRDGDGWVFADPANEYATATSLRWHIEGQEVLLADPASVVTAWTPLSPAAASTKRRSGTFTLDADGTLTGECRVEYTGHWNQLAKEQDDHETPQGRQKAYADTIAAQVPAAEVSRLEIENVTSPGNYTATYQIRVPGFAQKTGMRLIFQPAVFQQGAAAVFTSEHRNSDVYFPFPWSEVDELTIRLPEGFELEHPGGPPEVRGDNGTHSLTLGLRQGRTILVVARKFQFGLRGAIHFPAATYPSVKAFFDHVHNTDSHSLVLRRKASDQ